MNTKTKLFTILLGCFLTGMVIQATPTQMQTEKEAWSRNLNEKETTQRIKSLIKQMGEEIEKDQDRYPDLIGELESLIAECDDAPTRAILHSMAAEMYQNYFRNNRWKINRRTDMIGYLPDDIREWSANLFTEKIKSELELSLQDADRLQEIPIGAYRELLMDNGYESRWRPTLYDFLCWRAIEIQPSEALYQQLYSFRKSQSDKEALVMVELAYLAFYHNNLYDEETANRYQAELQRLLKEYAGNPISVEVIDSYLSYKQMMMHRSENSDSIKGEIYALCKEGLQRYAGYERIGLLQNRMNQLEQSLFSLVIPTTIYPGDPLTLRLHYTNLPKVKVTIYESRLSQKEMLRRPEDSVITKNRGAVVFEKEYLLDNPTSYLENVVKKEIPLSPFGLYECVISSSDGEMRSSTLFAVSRLASVIRSTSNKASELLVTDYKTGKPIEKGRVELYEMKQNQPEHQGSYTTDKNGLAVLPMKESHSFYYTISLGDDKASIGGQSYWYYSWNDDEEEEEDEPAVTLLTDRAIYRPGQTIYFKGIAFYTKKTGRRVAKKHTFTVELYDENGTEIGSQEMRTNEFGSFNGEFTLPKNGLSGEYELLVDDDYDYYTTVQVEEYKRPTFEVEWQPVTQEVIYGDLLTLKGMAKTFSGVALTSGEVTWQIEEQPMFWRWSGDSHRRQMTSGVASLNEKGEFEILFIPEERVSLWHGRYKVIATVTDSKGETQQGEFYFNVGKSSIYLSLDMPERVEKEKASLLVKGYDINGNEVKVSGSYRIVALNEVKGDEEDDTKFVEGKSVGAGQFEAWKELPTKVLSPLPSGRYRIKLTASDNKGRPTEQEKDIILFSKSDKRPPVVVPFWQTETELQALPGEKVSFTLGSSYQDAYMLYEVFAEDRMVSRQRIELDNEIKSFTLTYREAWGEGAMVVFTFVKEGKLHQTTLTLLRKKPDNKLTIRPVTFRDKLLPGNRESWTFSVTDASEQPVESEVVASMYDISLDQLTAHNWLMPAERRFYPLWNPFREGRSMSSEYGHARRDLVWVDVKEKPHPQLDWLGLNQLSSMGIYGSAMGMSNNLRSKSSGFVEEEALFAEADMSDQVVALGVSSDAGSEEETTSPAPAVQIRENFNETAFFYPTLRTNEAGEVLIEFTLPESNTTWKLQALAHTKDLKQGLLTQEVIASKPLMVLPNMPRFMRQGDELTVTTQIINQTEKEISGGVRLELFDPFTNQPVDCLTKADNDFTINPKATTTASWNVTVPNSINLVGCRIIAESAEGSDGEQHLVPVLNSQLLVTESTPFTLLNPGETLLKLTKGNAPYRMTLEATANPIWYAVQALPTISTPENESLLSWFAAYFSNTLATSIAASHPRVMQVIKLWQATGGDAGTLLSNLERNEELKDIVLAETPWVMEAKSESEQKQRLALLFDINRASHQREAALRYLLEKQNPDGGWGWFREFGSSRFITLTVLEGMSHLTQLSAISYGEEEKRMQMDALRFLDRSMRDDYNQLKKSNGDPKRWQQMQPSLEQITFLYIRSNYRDVPEEGDAREAIRFYTDRAEKTWQKQSLYSKAQTALLMHRNGKREVAQQIIASLRKTATLSNELGMYWANNRDGDTYYLSPLDVHTMLMIAFHEIAPDSRETDQMKQWLLSRKQTLNWNGMRPTLHAIHALLLTGSDWLGASQEVTIDWGGNRYSTNQGEAATGYLKQTINAEAVNDQHYTVTLSKEGDAPAWGAVYNQYFESIDKVTAQKGALSVEKKLFTEVNDGSQRLLQPVTEANPLRVGDKAVVRLTIRTDRDMSYVALKDLRAGCFEPMEQLSGYYFRDGVGYYQSPKDVSENFFFDRLPKGTYVIEYRVFVVRPGDFAGGISTIQCQYAPEFVSHTEGERIHVSSK
ncbi:alpha-2-macroglobulin [Parabacteroides sp. OttesenSCG-928-N08]|nr:alpha-2-macroglobulin [Parabacteroides sp. OttesenSCG-928-N08]